MTPKPHPADLIEVGSALSSSPAIFRADSSHGTEPERRPVLVIGAGQAGLSVAYHLKRRGVDHLILEGSNRIGDVWRNRWDSLRLFTPAKFDGLDGLRFPAQGDHFPTKNEMADYLETYAGHHALAVRTGARVERLHRANGKFRIETNLGPFEASQVVVAAASYQKPRLPDFSSGFAKEVTQLHSRDYRNPEQVADGPVLLIGAGNSGAEIAMDLAPTREVWLAGRGVGHIPFDISGFLGRKMLVRLVTRGLFHHLLTMRTPMGRRFRARMHGHGMPLIRTRPGQLKRAGVRRIDRITTVRDGKAVAQDGSEITPATVIWCTGFHPGFDWIDLPVLDADGEPRHRFGRAVDVDRLYFAGLHFQYAVSSAMVGGAGRDARRIADWVASCAR